MSGVKILITLLIIIASLCCAASQHAVESGLHQGEIIAAELKRSFNVYIPRGYDAKKKHPMVFVCHGGGGTARSAQGANIWDKKADAEGIIIVYPNGMSANPAKPSNFLRNQQTWNDGSSRPTVGAAERKEPDLQFFEAMIDELPQRYAIDTRRIYTTGFSNGASMSFSLARNLPDRIAAAAPIAGGDYQPAIIPDRIVPLLYMTGTTDPLNPMTGGPINIGMKSYGNKEYVAELMQRWQKLHQYQSPAVIRSFDKEIMHITCGPELEMVLLFDHGHHWPGSRTTLPAAIAGENTTKIYSADIIWEFFKQHQLPE